jgi:hypothetical protein
MRLNKVTSKTEKLFFKSEHSSIKYKKYFKVYDLLFSKYINKKITFVEIGVLNGGSLKIWKNFFGKKARIIGIDVNPKCKKFQEKGIEIYIGDQGNKNFWIDFFKKIGKVDVILDDGGHTNSQQITTTISTIPNINNEGLLIVEDTHSSYMKDFTNPNKFSFIEFSKKLIDDLNFTFPNIGKFKYSLNKYIYSIQYYESLAIFHVDRRMCVANKLVLNKGVKSGIKDLRWRNPNNYSKYKSLSYKKNFVYICLVKFIKNFIYTKKHKHYFK